MPEGKQKRIIIACTVGAVLLVVALLFIMIMQMIVIGVYKGDESDLEDAIAEYDQLIELTGETYETRSMRWWIVERARELGYVFKDDVKLN